MSQEMTRNTWVELSNLLPRVENAFQELEEKAHWLEKWTADLPNLYEKENVDPFDLRVPMSFTEDLDMLQHRVTIAVALLLPKLLPRAPTTPTPLIPDFDDAFPATPLDLFLMAVNALRWLEKCRNEEPSELGDEVKWLVPQFQYMWIDDGQHTISCGPDGTTRGITRSWLAGMLASQCREGRAKVHKWTLIVEAEVAKLACADAEQAKAQAEEKMAPLKEEVTFLRTQTLERLEKVDKSINGFKDILAMLVEKIESFFAILRQLPAAIWSFLFPKKNYPPEMLDKGVELLESHSRYGEKKTINWKPLLEEYGYNSEGKNAEDNFLRSVQRHRKDQRERKEQCQSQKRQ